MGVEFIREEGLPPLWICVDKVFAEVSIALAICKHFTSADSPGLLSGLARAVLAQVVPPAASARHVPET